MNDLRFLKDLTIHDVKPKSDEYTTQKSISAPLGLTDYSRVDMLGPQTPILSLTMYSLNDFSKVNSPTKPSTHRLLYLRILFIIFT